MSVEYKLPNGCIITPGGRIRIPRKQIALIPEVDREKYGLFLDDNAWSAGSEVVCMPAEQGTELQDGRP